MLAVACLAVTPAVASAHGALRSSQPASGARLTTAPRELRLTFTEAPELAVARVALLGPDGTAVALAPLAVATDGGRTVVAAVRGALTAGAYTVSWQIAGADGHPVRGRYAFVIAAGAAGLTGAPGLGQEAAAPGATDAGPATEQPSGVTVGEAGAGVRAPGQPPVAAEHHDPVSMPERAGFDAESPLYVAVRWATYTALLVVLGAVAFRLAVLGLLARQRPGTPLTGPASDHAARIGLWAAGALGVLALARLAVQAYALQEPGGAFDAGLIGPVIARTVWGWGWLLQVAGVLVAALGFQLARRGQRTGWTLAAVGVGALAFFPGLSGHAASTPTLAPLAILADGVHVIGAGGWLGSLLLVVAVGLPVALSRAEAERGPAAADLVNAFSPTALGFAGLVAVTGAYAAWIHVGSIPALWETGYGKLLLLKLGVLSIVAGTGAYNWLRVRPALGDVEGARRIGRSAKVELAVGVLVLVVTAVLVATPTAMDDAMEEQAAAVTATAP